MPDELENERAPETVASEEAAAPAPVQPQLNPSCSVPTPRPKSKRVPPNEEPVAPPPKVVLRAVDKLGYSSKIWDKAKLMALEQCGKFLDSRKLGRVLLVRNIHTLEQTDLAKEWAIQIITSTSKEITTDQRMVASQVLAVVADVERKINDQSMDFAERVQDKIADSKPKNLPPAVVQVNIVGATPSPSPAMSPAANTGTMKAIHDAKPS